ncbi:MAG TPA: hypothetical protein VMH36_09270 [Alphaproteobacteria bacterium]|nr:hypothetical protein [Alphaproteobacteria bacterium]
MPWRVFTDVRGMFALVVLLLAGCAEPPQRTADNEAYQACLARGYRMGDLPYAATRFYQSHVEDRLWAPARSPVAQCNEYQARGEL